MRRSGRFNLLVARLALLAAWAVLGVSAYAFLTGKESVQALESQTDCVRYYGAPVANAPFFRGIPGRTSWEDASYRYSIVGFALYSENVNAASSTLIDSREPDARCRGGNGPGQQDSDWIRMENLTVGGYKPIGAYLGVPTNAPANGNWSDHNEFSRGSTLETPPTHYQQQPYQAGYVDDGAKAVIENASGQQSLLWCAFIDTDYKPSENCKPDAVAAQEAFGIPVAGSLFVGGEGVVDGLNFNNCSGVLCSDNYRKWYAQSEAYTSANKVNYTNLIGTNADGSLRDFQLHMQVRQTAASGYGAWFVMTFKYPKPSAQCISITAPESVNQGRTFNATVQVRNNGSVTWNSTGANPYRLGASDPRDTAKWGPISPGGFSNRALFSGNVAPGQTATVNFTATATTAGIQPFSWEVLREGIDWVGGKCTTNINVTGDEPPLLHKIYAANIIELSKQQVRDNETFVATLRAYIWPDAGLRSVSGDRGNRLWLAGIYGDQAYLSGDNANGDNSKRANPNAMTSFNTRAEESCPGSSCKERVPMAYVTANDGAGVATTSTKDGSTTPNGNKWYNIREENHGSWDSRLGGIASTRTDSIGGYSGSRINNVEISNIRVEAVGPRADSANTNAQGGVTSSTLQPDSTTQGANLPPSSQGPIRNGLPFNAWDNIRRPGAPGGLTVTSQQPSVEFGNASGRPANFTTNPEQLLSVFSTTVNSNSRPYATANITSLLQDGNDRDNGVPYSNLSEPLTYTAGLASIDNVRLKWDEYVDWTQVDDKGHYYTDQSYPPRATGFYTGSSTSVTKTVVSSVSTGTQKVTYHPPVTRTTCVERDKRGRCTRTQTTTTPGWYEYEQPTCSNYNTGVRQTNSTYTYYTPSVQSRWGWVNRNATFGNAYASPSPTRFWPSRGGTPTWATLGTGDPLNPFFWQDPSVTTMSNSGSTNRNGASQSPAWSRDFADPTYANRYLFVNAQSESIPTGWEYTQSTFCYYANGGTVTNTTASTSYYGSPGYLYENSTGSYTGVRGIYNFTYDGNKDGHVDISWSWAPNLARVHYEHTYNGNYRNLGPRSASGAGGADGTLYGIEGYPSAAKLARATATIGSPVIGAASGDIFSAGGISSYFRNSAASSAFIFTNTGTITNFLGASGYFPNYYINPDPNRVNQLTLPGAPDSIHKVWPSFDTEVIGRSQTIGGSMSGSFNLAGTANRIYRVAGDLNLGATTFCGGPGTIYVEGNLNINGNLSYCGYSGTDRSQVPSLGVIVRGRINVNPGVTNIVGSYFTNGTFSTGSVLDSAGTNRTSSDQPLVLNGLVIAYNFALQRQPSGSSNLSGVAAERFIYDGRVVVATPPAFNSLYNAPAVWNEAAPSN